ncbi:hypothetical protein JCM10449v2_007109 [Rhodotorula kratochvilovae]
MAQQTVYVGELEGLRLALHTLTTLPPLPFPSTAHLCANNQAAVLHPTSPAPSSGQHLCLAIRAPAQELKTAHPNLCVSISWVPGHAGIEGNERADLCAKAEEEVRAPTQRRRRGVVMPRRGIDDSLALSSDEGDEWWGGEGETSARAASSARHVIAPLARLVNADERLEDRRAMVKSVAAVKQAFKEEQARAWEARWRAHPRGAGLREIAPQPPGAAFARYHAQLSRRPSSLLARLRLDFIGLNRHKQRIQRHPNGLCDCGAAIETRAHFLLECTLHAAPRAALLRELHLSTMPPLERLLSDPARARPLLRFINSTDRFPRLYEVVDAEQDGTRAA